jgi:3',5'-cyclic AMP phosphodiesterase CpdA
VTPEPTITPVPLPTAAATDSAQTKFSFAVIGDNRGNLDVYQSLLQMVQQDGNSFMIHLGDLVNDGTADEFQAWREVMTTFTLPFYPVPGNHDSGQAGLAEYLAFSGAPAAHYSFDKGDIHFALVDSHLGYLTAEESAWLDTDLARTQQPIKIVALHYPPFDPAGSSHVMTMGNDAFMSLMRKHGVQYVFAGHIHAYGQETRNGITYIISGGAGAPLVGTEAEGGFYHYIKVTVDGTSVQTEVRRLAP